jgi:hypothetical protein
MKCRDPINIRSYFGDFALHNVFLSRNAGVMSLHRYSTTRIIV